MKGRAYHYLSSKYLSSTWRLRLSFKLLSDLVKNRIAEEAMNDLDKRAEISSYKHETNFSPLAELARLARSYK